MRGVVSETAIWEYVGYSELPFLTESDVYQCFFRANHNLDALVKSH